MCCNTGTSFPMEFTKEMSAFTGIKTGVNMGHSNTRGSMVTYHNRTIILTVKYILLHYSKYFIHSSTGEVYNVLVQEQ